ncbi:MAG: hypothetical protein ACOVQ7_01195 [Limnoraphis robusta]
MNFIKSLIQNSPKKLPKFPKLFNPTELFAILMLGGLIVIVFLFFMGFQILVFLGVGGEPLKKVRHK